MHMKSSADEAEMFSDGTTKSVYLVTNKQYIQEKAPSSRETLIGLMPGGMMGLGSMWLAGFLSNDKAMLDQLTGIEYVGQEKDEADASGKTMLDHLLLHYREFDLDVWLQTGDKPLLQRFRMDLAKSVGQVQGHGAAPNVTVAFQFSNWQPEVKIADERFAFTPPDGVTRYEPASKDGAEDESALLKKPAPDFTLGLLDGSKLNLAALKGKKIVILDFWATWCGPCRMAMPVVAQVAKEYANRDVVLYAVNQRETPEQIRAFLEKAQLEVSVALDRDAKVGSVYGANAIPRMVVIDKNGIVQAVHAGMSPALKDDLTEELNGILEGQANAAGGGQS
jgi:thiol-disulfide isomerase/thioredoxin